VAATVSVSSSSAAAVLGKLVTLSASVIPATAPGTVTFLDGQEILGSAPLLNGFASLSTASIGVGRRSITARFAGADHSLATSAPISETITTRPGGALSISAISLPFSGFVAQSLLVADLNRDGHPDIVCTNGNGNSFGPNTINVFLNHGDGTFAPAAPYLVGMTASHVAAADVDLDGNPDLLVSTQSGLALLPGNGDGTFGPPSLLMLATDLNTIRIADVNLDGIPDVLVAHTQTAAISVLQGNGDGTFQDPIVTGINFTITDFLIGDFNQDGTPDLAIAGSLPRTVAVLTGAGDGSFSTPIAYHVPAADAILSADVNGDGIADLVTAGNPGGVLLGNANGTFRSAITTPVGSAAIAISDFDGDGIPDVVSTGAGVSIAFGNGDGTYRTPVILYQSPGQNLIAVADFDGDGLADVASTGNGSTPGSPVSIFRGVLAPVLSISVSPSPANASQAVTITVKSNRTDATGTITVIDFL
jgi:hypothetical protein